MKHTTTLIAALLLAVPTSSYAQEPTSAPSSKLKWKLVSIQLFAKGYLRAETKVDAAQTDQTFTLSNLFEGDNTLIATAVDDHGHVGLSAPVRVNMKTAEKTSK
jgi:hypothetical protein